MTTRSMLGKRGCLEFIASGVLLLFLARPLAGLDPDQPLAQLYHSSWTAKDGLPGMVTSIAQTSDGFLWIGTTEGLIRFDGLTFEAYKPEVGAFPATMIMTLCAAPEGLWIGYVSGGISFLKNGKVRNYSDRDGLPVSRVGAIVRDHDGTIWAAAVGGVARLEGDRWHKVRMDWGFPAKAAEMLLVDPHGTLWASTRTGVLFLPKGGRKFQDAGVNGAYVGDLSAAKDGTLWFADSGKKQVCALRRLSDRETFTPVCYSSNAEGLLVDRSGALWLLNIAGFLRVAHPERLKESSFLTPGSEVEEFTENHGLTSNAAFFLCEDREGNMWVGTDRGLDRFRRRNLSWYATPGKPSLASFSLVVGEGGEPWAASSSGPTLRLPDREPVASAPKGVRLAYRDPSGTLWFSSLSWWLTRGLSERLPVPKEIEERLPISPRDPLFVLSMAKDRTGALWVAAFGRGEFCLKDGRWTFVKVLQDHPDWTANATLADHEDRIWLAYDPLLAVLQNGTARAFAEKDGPGVGPIKVIKELEPYILVGGESGVSLFHQDRFRPLLGADGANFGFVTSIVTDPRDGVWLAGFPGIVHIAAAEIDKAAKQPGYGVKYEVLDLVSDLPDPLQRGTAWGDKAIMAPDGGLWFATIKGFARVDPKGLYRNPIPPPVIIRSLVSDDRRYSAFHDATLPALSRSIRFDYTALSLSIPERVRFRYRLDGFDPDWRDGGSDRKASYDNLGPGTYTFRVIASNNDGVWNETGATMNFTLLPAWHQTIFFQAACGCSAMLLLWGIYRLRIRQVAAAMTARFNERLVERTRIARELHDTLLQTIQASKLVSEDALEKRDDPVRVYRSMEQVSVWLGQAVLEGRAALDSLRISTTRRNNLAEAFERATQEGILPGTMSVELLVTGEVREMHPIVRDEVYRIGYEAIRNACLHSSASKLVVELQYGRDLCLRISDNGVGIDPQIVETGRTGHFGLTGMRERASRIASNLDLVGSPGSGTTVRLLVPGHVAFRTFEPGKRRSFAARLRRTKFPR